MLTVESIAISGLCIAVPATGAAFASRKYRIWSIVLALIGFGITSTIVLLAVLASMIALPQ